MNNKHLTIVHSFCLECQDLKEHRCKKQQTQVSKGERGGEGERKELFPLFCSFHRNLFCVSRHIFNRKIDKVLKKNLFKQMASPIFSEPISSRVRLEGSQKLFKFSPFLGIIERSKS